MLENGKDKLETLVRLPENLTEKQIKADMKDLMMQAVVWEWEEIEINNL